jgi:hypothetical protein
MSTPKITATMLATVLQVPAAVVVLDESAGDVRVQTCLTRDQADDPNVVVLLDYAGATGYLRATGKPGAAAAAATIDARLALSA